jgi:hypothetical protein
MRFDGPPRGCRRQQRHRLRLKGALRSRGRWTLSFPRRPLIDEQSIAGPPDGSLTPLLITSQQPWPNWSGKLKALGSHQPFVADNFAITLDPVKVIQMSVGALLFARPDVKPARETVARS